jgi:hypothetical protein
MLFKCSKHSLHGSLISSTAYTVDDINTGARPYYGVYLRVLSVEMGLWREESKGRSTKRVIKALGTDTRDPPHTHK